MDLSAGVGPRWTRAGLLVAVAMVSGIVAHEAAGGIMPGPVALVALLAVCAAMVAPLLGRPVSALRVVVLVMAGQTLVHGTLTGPHAAMALAHLAAAAAVGLAARIVTATSSLARCRPDPDRLPPRSQVLDRVVVRRGPPRLLPA